MADRERLELSTTRLTVAGSAIELPINKMVQLVGFEPTIFPPQTERDTRLRYNWIKWYSKRDSNPR